MDTVTEPSTHPLPSLALYTAIAGPLAVLVLLVWSGFFWGADGWIAAHRVFVDDNPMTAVVVEDSEGAAWDLLLPTPVVKRLAVPELRSGFLTPRKPKLFPTLHKDRFSLELTLVHADGVVEIVPTTSPYGLAAAVLLFVVGFFVRNMLVSGSPLYMSRRPMAPVAQATAGQPAARRKERGTKGPPPKGRRKGQRRR
jgi:hypothetical protein